ncbi:MAG: CCA tRNA nucleotidyltransferase [Anaerolineales bacterium]|nr:MAG: CCA tRNA nucleotidyltransferase [Anaerolineales bacterium]
MFKLEALPLELETLLAQQDRIDPIWIVGGAIRDHLLRRHSHDVDFTTSGDAIALARRVADQLGADVYILDGERGAGRVLHRTPDGRRQTFDFAQLRGDTIEADLRDRDFTVNALGLRISALEMMIDPCGGLQHLRDGIIELCAADAIDRDPVRALRAIRLATDLGFRISHSTTSAIRATASLSQISAERIRDEFFNTLALMDPTPAFQLLAHLKLLPLIFQHRDPDLEPDALSLEDRETMELALRGLRHLVSILRLLAPEADLESAAQAALGLLTWTLGRFRLPLGGYFQEELSFNHKRRELILMATFLYPLFPSEPAGSTPPTDETLRRGSRQKCEQIGAQLRLSRDEIEWFDRWIEALKFLEHPSDPAANIDLLSYRYYRQARDAGVASVLSMLAYELAQQIEPPAPERWTARIEIARTHLDAWFDKHDVLVDPQSLIDGHDVMESLGSKPGPEIGRIIEHVREGQVVGGLATRKQAIAFIKKEFGSRSG